MTATPADTRSEVEKLERKHAENPEGRYFVPLANAYRKAGNVDQAIRVLRQGLGKHPEYVSAHIVLGRCFADTGNLDGAAAEFQHVLTLDSHNLVALRTLGELAVASNRLEDARKWYESLLAVDPMNEEAREALDSLGQTGPAGPAQEPAPSGASPVEAAPQVGAAPPTVKSAVTPREREYPSPFDEGSSFDGEMVVTETIAELYTKQGFFDRAAVVYRELIRRRGEEPKLLERLVRVERLAAGESEADLDALPSAAPSSATEAPSSTAEVEAGHGGTYDAFAESFEAGFPVAELAVSDPSQADSRSPAVEGAAPTAEVGSVETASIRSLLRQVFRLPPALAAVPQVDLTTEEPASVAPFDHVVESTEAAVEDEWASAAASAGPSFEADLPHEPSGEEWQQDAAAHAIEEASPAVSDGTPWGLDDTVSSETPAHSWEGVTPEVVAEDEWAGTAAPSSEQAAEAPSAEPAAQPTSPGADDELFPWELPEDYFESGRSSSEHSAKDREVRLDLPVEAPLEPTSEQPPVTQAPELDDPFDVAAEASPPPTEPKRAPKPDDDDDLESFQAWLRSLKR